MYTGSQHDSSFFKLVHTPRFQAGPCVIKSSDHWGQINCGKPGSACTAQAFTPNSSEKTDQHSHQHSRLLD